MNRIRKCLRKSVGKRRVRRKCFILSFSKGGEGGHRGDSVGVQSSVYIGDPIKDNINVTDGPMKGGRKK